MQDDFALGQAMQTQGPLARNNVAVTLRRDDASFYRVRQRKLKLQVNIAKANAIPGQRPTHSNSRVHSDERRPRNQNRHHSCSRPTEVVLVHGICWRTGPREIQFKTTVPNPDKAFNNNMVESKQTITVHNSIRARQPSLLRRSPQGIACVGEQGVE